jgi:hypothetical protein
VGWDISWIRPSSNQRHEKNRCRNLANSLPSSTKKKCSKHRFKILYKLKHKKYNRNQIICLVRDWVWWRALVNTIMNLRMSKKTENYLTIWATDSLWIIILLHGIGWILNWCYLGTYIILCGTTSFVITRNMYQTKRFLKKSVRNNFRDACSYIQVQILLKL